MNIFQNRKHVLSKAKELIFILLLLSSNHVISQEGSLDISFSMNGVLILPNPPANNGPYNVITDATNNIFIYGGSQILKLKEDGQYDTSFSNSGIFTLVDTQINRCIILPNDKIVAVGKKDNGLFISRIDSNGNLDTSFGTNGFFNYDYGFGIDEGLSIIENNSNFIVAGYITNDNNNKDFLILKITQDGILDESFGNQGVIIANNSNNDDILNDIIIDDNNIIFACGSTYDPNAYFDNRSDISIIKINSNELDTSFGNNGVLILDNYSNESAMYIDYYNDSLFITVKTMTIQGDFSNLNFYKTDTNGTLDNDFGSAGIKNIFHQLGSPFDYNKPIKQENGKFVFATKLRFNETYTRINGIDGAIDESYGEGGEFFQNINRSNITSIAKQFDNRLLALGIQYNGSVSQHVLTRHILNDNLLQINDNKFDDFVAYPNPNNGILFLKNGRNSNVNKVTIYNMIGKKLMELTSDFDRINLESFDSGIYLLEIVTNSSITSKKIVKL